MLIEINHDSTPSFYLGAIPMDINFFAIYNNKYKSKIKQFYISRVQSEITKIIDQNIRIALEWSLC